MSGSWGKAQSSSSEHLQLLLISLLKPLDKPQQQENLQPPQPLETLAFGSTQATDLFGTEIQILKGQAIWNENVA